MAERARPPFRADHVGSLLRPPALKQAREEHALGVELDRTWDLLRRREARRRVGQDPDEERERSASVVEGYQQ